MGRAEFVGVDGLTVAVYELEVVINQGGGTNAGLDNTTVVNFSGLPGGGMDIDTGDGTPVLLDFTTESLKVEGRVEMDLFGFFYVSGGFAFEKTIRTIRVTDGIISETVEVSVLTVGASNVNAFAGVNGPYWTDTNNNGQMDAGETNDDALGLFITDVDFALVLMKPTSASAPGATDLRNWTSLKATVREVGFVGISGLTVKVTSLSVEINSGGGTKDGVANTMVADFSQAPLLVNTGPNSELALNFDGAQGSLLRASGALTIGIGGFAIRGGFAIEKTEQTFEEGGKKIRRSKLLLGAAGVHIFLGAGEAPYDNEDTGVLVEDVQFGMVLFKDTDITAPNNPQPVPDSSKMALTASGGARLLGIDGLVLSGTLQLRKNDTGFTQKDAEGFVVNETLNIPDPTKPGDFIPVAIKFKENISLGLSGTVIFKIVDPATGTEFVSLKGGFAFTKTDTEEGTVTTSKIKIGAAGVEAFVGVGPAKIPNTSTPDPNDEMINPDAMGLLIENLEVGVVLIKKVDSADPAATSSTFAIDGSGGARLLGIDGLELSGTLGVRLNKTGTTVNEHVTVPLPDGGSKDVPIVFNNAFDELQISGTINLNILDLVSLSGGFAFKKQVTPTETKIMVGAASVEAFVGIGPLRVPNTATPDPNDVMINPDAIGVLGTISELGLVLYKTGGKTSFALTGSGGIALVGLDGLDIEGTARVDVNKSGRTVDETIDVPNPKFDDSQPAGPSNPETISVAVFFSSPSDVLAFGGSIKIKVVSVFELSGTVSFRRAANGSVQVDIPDASVKVVIGGKDIVGLSGHAKFASGGPGGFQLQDFGIHGFSIFGLQADIAPKPAAVSPPTADLIGPANGGVINNTDLVLKPYIDVTFNDPSGNGLDHASIVDPLPEFSLKGPGGATLNVDGKPRKIGFNTYRYTLTNVNLVSAKLGDWQVEFKANSWKDKGGRKNTAEVETFTVREGPKPTANLANPKNGVKVDLTLLNARKYIDVTFNDFSGAGIDPATILDSQPEFTIAGTGVADAGQPFAVSGSPQLLRGNTYRYRITDATPADEINLFKAGTVTVQFAADAWRDKDGSGNSAKSENFTVVGATAGSAKAKNGLSIGPLTIAGPTVGITGLSFKDKKLVLTIALGAELASLNFGGGGGQQSQTQSSSGVKVELTGLLGTFDLSIDLLGFLQGSGSIDLAGKWSVDVNSFLLDIPNLLTAGAEGIKFGYDPDYKEEEHPDPVNPGKFLPQEIIVINSAFISIPKLKLSGGITPYDPDGPQGPAVPIPGLVIHTKGFKLGTAIICYGCTTPPGSNVPIAQGTTNEPAIKLGTILEFDDIRFGISGLEITFGEAFAFTGEIFIASGGARFFPGKPVNAVISDRLEAEPDAADPFNTEALRATISFNDEGKVDSFKFEVDTFRIELGEFLALKGVGICLDTGATGEEEVVSVVSIGAELQVASLKLSGEGRNFAFLGNGKFKAKPGFGVFFGVEAATGAGVGWPEWLPIKIDEIGIEWRDINNRPLDFILTLSASVESIGGIPGAEFSGTIEGVKIDLGRLWQGQFPIIDIAAIGVTIKADVFGGKLDAGLIGGILKIGNDNQLIGALAPPDTPVKDRVFFIGIQGGFEVAGIGMTIRFALSELGPLGVQLEARSPVGIPIALPPPVAAARLFINDFVGGVEFYMDLPDIEEAKELRRPEFAISAADVDADAWLDTVKLQVYNQYLAVKANPVLRELGFLAAFTSPMTITGSVKIYTDWVSKFVFNAQVGIKITTTGKFLAVGKFNFADGLLSISGKLFFNMGQIASGRASMFFLFDAPEQLELLTIGGKLELLFGGPNGENVEFDFADPLANPEVVVAYPGDGGTSILNDLNDKAYIEINYVPSDGASLDEASILDDEPEFKLTGDAAADVKILDDAVEKVSDGVYRYPFEDAFTAGVVGVEFEADSFGDDASITNLEYSTSFTLKQTAAVLAAPENGRAIDVMTINQMKYISVRYFASPGFEVDESTINDGDVVFTLALANGATLDVAGPGSELAGAYRYVLPDSFEFVPGEVTVSFAAGTWSDTGGYANAATVETFVVTGPVADLYDPAYGGRVDVVSIRNQTYFDVKFSPARDNNLVVDSILDDDVAFTIKIGDGEPIEIRGPPDALGGNVFRYTLPDTVTFDPGQVEVSFPAGSFEDDGGYLNAAETETFTVIGPVANLAEPRDERIIGVTQLNGNGYIDVTFRATSGNAMDSDSITDELGEFTLKCAAASNVEILDDQVEKVGDNTYRYPFNTDPQKKFGVGIVTIEFIENSWADSAGFSNLAETERFFVEALTADLVDPLHTGTADLNIINDRGYVLVEFHDDTGYGLDEASILDSGSQNLEFRFSGEGAGTATLTGQVEKVEDDVFKFFFAGNFEEGLVEVNFIENSWQDTEGNGNLAETERFWVIKKAISIKFIIEGFAELHGGGFTPDYDGDGKPDPLISLRGRTELSIDMYLDANGIPAARFQLDFNSTLELFYLGNVGSAAGRLILTMGATPSGKTSIFGPVQIQLWGVLKVDTNLEKLREIGIEADATALLQINVTNETKTEVIFLEGIRGDALFTIDDNGISGELPADLSPGSFTKELPQGLKAAFAANAVDISDAVTIQGVESGKRWKIYDNGNDNKQYFVKKTGNQLTIYHEGQTFELEPYTFAISLAGAIKFKIPPIEESDPELFRISGAFHLQIGPRGAEMFVKGDLTLGPEYAPILEFDVLGLIIINFQDPGFAARLNLSLYAGIEGIMEFEAEFNLYINATISASAQDFRVPDLFLDPEKGFLDQKFLDSLEYGTGEKLFDVSDGDGSIKEALDAWSDPEAVHTIPAALRAAFTAKGITLPADAKVRVIYNESRWEIYNNSGLEYIVETSKHSPTKLNIHASKGKYYVSIPRGPPQLDNTIGTAGPYVVISGAGGLTIADMFVMQGAFRFELSMDKLELQISATMRLGDESNPLFLFQVIGFLEIDWDSGVIGLLKLQRKTGGLMKEIGFDVEASFLLELNSTSEDREALILLGPGETTTVVIPAKTFRIAINGHFIFNPGGVELFRLSGVFYLEITQDGSLNIFTDVKLLLGPPEARIFTFEALGLLIFKPDGNMGIRVKLTGDVSLGDVLQFDCEFEFLMNTSGTEYVFEVPDQFKENVGYDSVSIPAGPPGITGEEGEAGFYIVIKGEGSLSLMGGILEMDGRFYFKISATEGLTLLIAASAKLEPLGVVGASGFLDLNNEGIVGSLQLEVGAGLGTDLFSFSGYFRLALNTRSTEGTIFRLQIDPETGDVADELIESTVAARTLIVEGGGELDIAGMFTIRGAFYLKLSPEGFEIQFDASMELGGFGRAGVKGAAAIYRDGTLVISLELDIEAISIPLVNIKGRFVFEINTSKTTEYFGVAPNSFLVRISAEVSILLFKGVGDLSLSYKNGVFEVAIHELSINFFNFISIEIDGYFRSNGQFRIHGKVEFSIPMGLFRLYGGVEITLENNYFHGRIWGGVDFEIDLGFFSISFTLASLEAEIALTPVKGFAALTITVMGMKMRGSITWTWGPTPTLATQVGNVLYLNVGDRARYRGKYFDEVADESYRISQSGNTVNVSAMGYTKSYSGVTKIVGEFGNADDTLWIEPSVTADVEIDGGSGNDLIIHSGSGIAKIYGCDGDDEIYGSPGADMIFGQLGLDKLTGNGASTTCMAARMATRSTDPAVTTSSTASRAMTRSEAETMTIPSMVAPDSTRSSAKPEMTRSTAAPAMIISTATRATMTFSEMRMQTP